MPTIGVAIAIPQPFEAVLADQRAAVGDPLAASVPPHVTLLPPTVVTDAELADFVVHLAQVAEAAAPFEMALQSTGTFRPVSPVVFVQVARGISDCELLEKAIRSGPIERDVLFAYHPHVTIAHHLDDAALDKAYAALADFSAAFPVHAISLYCHGTDAVWRTEREFVLEGMGTWSD